MTDVSELREAAGLATAAEGRTGAAALREAAGESEQRAPVLPFGMLPGLTVPSRVRDIARSLTQGATFAFGDEAEATIRALWDRGRDEDFSDAYLRFRNQARTEMERFREAHPALAIGTEMAGGVAIPGLGTATAVGRGTTTGGRVALGAASGAATGAAFGAGVAEEARDLRTEVPVGAALGGLIGAAVPAGVAGTAAAIRGVRGAVTPEAGARARIAQAIRRDEMTPGQLAGALDEARRLGRPATVADVGGEAVRRELEVAVQSPGAAGQIAGRFLEARNRDQLARLSRDLVRGTDVPARTVNDAIEQTMRIRANAARPLYERAMSFAAELNDDIVETYANAIKTPLGKQALANARKILNVEKFDEAPLMERIDAFKRGLDDVIGASQRKGENAIARQALKVKNELIEMVDAVNPDYKRARAVWEDASSYLNAIDRGRDILKPGVTASKLQREFGALSDAEQEAFRLGAVDAVVTRMRQQSAQEPNLIKLMRSPEMRDKLKAVMSPERAREFDRILDIEDAMFRTASQARRGSPTAQRQAAQAEQEKQLRALRGIDSLLELVLTPMRALFTRAIPSISRAARDSLLARQNAAIARRLLQVDPDEAMALPGLAPTAPRVAGGRAIPPAIIGGDEATRPE